MSTVTERYLQWLRKVSPASKVDIAWRYNSLIAQLEEIKTSIDRLESRIDGIEGSFLFFDENKGSYSSMQAPSVATQILDQDRGKQNKFRSFWFGGDLSPLAWLSLSSFARQHQDTELYCYDRINLPQGIAWMPADEIITQNKVFRIQESYAAFSDIFRYSLLLKKGGWWIDTDVLCIGGEFPKSKVLFAEEARGLVCGAIMKFPKNHICLKYMLWETRNLNLNNFRWGDVGPKLLTRAVSLYGGYPVFPAEKIYPIHALEAHKFILPEFFKYVSEKVREANFVHFWNNMFVSLVGFDTRNERPLPGSFLDSLYVEYGIYDKYDLAVPNEKALRETCSKFLKQKWVREYAKLNRVDI